MKQLNDTVLPVCVTCGWLGVTQQSGCVAAISAPGMRLLAIPSPMMERCSVPVETAETICR